MPVNDVNKINEATEKLTGTAREYYEAALQSTTAMQKSNARLAWNVFENNFEALKKQAEINSYTLQSMAEQIRRNREMFQELSMGSLDAYDGFLDSLSSYYEEVSKKPESPDAQR